MYFDMSLLEAQRNEITVTMSGRWDIVMGLWGDESFRASHPYI